MKKMVCSLLALILLMFCMTALAEPKSIYGNWEVMAYKDEFDMPTGDYSVVNLNPIYGKFSNSATTNSDLVVFLYCDKYTDTHADYIGFRLFEYANPNFELKNSYSQTKQYDIIVMDSTGVKHYLNGYIKAKSRMMLVDTAGSEIIISALKAGGTVRFAITASDDALNKYTFTIDDAAGFDEAYAAWKSK